MHADPKVGWPSRSTPYTHARKLTELSPEKGCVTVASERAEYKYTPVTVLTPVKLF
jgi:hypothetical protein